MSLTVIDYLEGYNVQCSRRKATPIRFLQMQLAECIDNGKIPTSFILRGNHPELREWRITDDYLEVLIIPFNGHDFLTTLDLSFNRITDVGCGTLAQWLKENKFLKELYLVSNDIQGGGAGALADALVVNNMLTVFDLSNNPLGGDGGMALAAMLQVNQTLERLHLHGCDFSLPSLIALFTVLQSTGRAAHVPPGLPSPPAEGPGSGGGRASHGQGLHTIDVADNAGAMHYELPSLHADFVRHLAHMLAVNVVLRNLSLRKLNVDDHDVTLHLAAAIEAARNLQLLDLSSNRIMYDGAVKLADMLPRHTSLRGLRLSHNTLGSDGCIELSKSLKDNAVLQALHLDHNNIGADALVELAKILDVEPAFTTGDGPRFERPKRIVAGRNSTLREITLWGNHFQHITSAGRAAAVATTARTPPPGGIDACAAWKALLSCNLPQEDDERAHLPIYARVPEGTRLSRRMDPDAVDVSFYEVDGKWLVACNQNFRSEWFK